LSFWEWLDMWCEPEYLSLIAANQVGRVSGMLHDQRSSKEIEQRIESCPRRETARWRCLANWSLEKTGNNLKILQTNKLNIGNDPSLYLDLLSLPLLKDNIYSHAHCISCLLCTFLKMVIYATFFGRWWRRLWQSIVHT